MTLNTPPKINLPPSALLVSVRSASEAIESLAGGADVIDIKEPGNGPLGAAEAAVIREVIEAVDQRRPVTAAAGELLEERSPRVRSIPGILMVKVGLAGLRGTAGWEGRLAATINHHENNALLVPVAYADHEQAAAPPPDQVIAAAAQISASWAMPASWVMIDTFAKADATLFDTLSEAEVAALINAAHAAGLRIALAGSLNAEAALLAWRLGADMVGVRGAACPSGRLGKVGSKSVRTLADACSEARVNRRSGATPAALC